MCPSLGDQGRRKRPCTHSTEGLLCPSSSESPGQGQTRRTPGILPRTAQIRSRCVGRGRQDWALWTNRGVTCFLDSGPPRPALPR